MNEPSARSGYDISEVAGAKVPGVSVVVPAYNAVATLGECLKAITDSAYPDLEVLVVDDGSDDGSVLVAEEYSCRSITSEKNIGAAAVRNLGVSEATNSILVFIDSDVVVKKDSISKLISVLVSDMNLAGVSGVYEADLRFRNFLSRYKHFVVCYRDIECKDINQDSFRASFLALRKEVFKEHRFNESFNHASIEDIEFGRELINSGYTFFLDKGNRVEHLKKYTLGSYLKNQYRRSKDIMRRYLTAGSHEFYNNGERGNTYAKLYLLRVPIALLTILIWMVSLFLDRPMILIAVVIPIVTSIILEINFLMFCFERSGLFFSVRCVLMYFFEGIICGLGAIHGILSSERKRGEWK